MLAALGTPPFGTVSAVESRAAMAARPLPPGAPVARVEDMQLPSASGEIPVRIYTPDWPTPLPVLVWYHGGGWVLGTLDASDHTCRELANAAGCIVVSVDYRLAPEHKFPASPDDCEAAYEWVLANAASFGGDPRRVAVGGDSAGGNLAAVVCIRARERNTPQPVFQVLVYPVTDLYVNNPDEMAHPHASPLRAADLSGLAPALVITAEFDPLRDEGEAYGERLKEAGVPVIITRYDGMIHGFFGQFPVIDKGKVAVREAADALVSAFALQPA
jgi:acetyl esterase